MNANEHSQYFIAGFECVSSLDKTGQVVLLNGYGITIFFRVVDFARDVLPLFIARNFPRVYFCHWDSLAVKHSADAAILKQQSRITKEPRIEAGSVVNIIAIEVAGVAVLIKRVFFDPSIVILQDKPAGQVLTRLTSDGSEP